MVTFEFLFEAHFCNKAYAWLLYVSATLVSDVGHEPLVYDIDLMTYFFFSEVRH